jgi:hypothetical protein
MNIRDKGNHTVSSYILCIISFYLFLVFYLDKKEDISPTIIQRV